jgi:hypothetical protein
MTTSGCIGVAPTNWVPGDSADLEPDNLLYSFGFSVVFFIEFLLLMRYNRKTRVVPNPWCGEKQSNEEFMQVNSTEVEANYPFPSVLIFALIYLIGNYILGTMIQIISFYIFWGLGSKNEDDMACNLQWYSVGSPLAGTLQGFLINTGVVAFLAYVGIVARNRMASGANQKIAVQTLLSLIDFNGQSFLNINDKDHHFELFFPLAADCLRPFKFIKELQRIHFEDPTLITKFHATYADKYGTGKDEIDIEQICVERFAKIEGIADICTPLKLQPVQDQYSDHRVNFPDSYESKFDYIIIPHAVTFRYSPGLGLASSIFTVDEESNRSKKNRQRIFLAECMPLLKPNGNFIICNISDTTELEETRNLFIQAGYQADIFQNERETKKSWFKDYVVEMAPSYSVIAKLSPSLVNKTTSAGNSTNTVTGTGTGTTTLKERASVYADANKISYSEPILDSSGIFKIYLIWVFLIILVYFGFVFLTVVGWDTMMFPEIFPQQFSLLLLGFVQSLPLTMLLACIVMYNTFYTFSRPTKSTLNQFGFWCLIGMFILGTIQSLPSWILNTVVKYYIFDKLFGIPTTSTESNILYTVFLVIMIRYTYTYFLAKYSTKLNYDELNKKIEEDGEDRIVVPIVQYSTIYGDDFGANSRRPSVARSAASTRSTTSLTVDNL